MSPLSEDVQAAPWTRVVRNDQPGEQMDATPTTPSMGDASTNVC